jgi:tetratricopeptide (TPR) repeat protein
MAALRQLCRDPTALPLVERFLDKGANVNYSDCSGSGSTPLAAACFGDAIETVRHLVEERGADVTAVDEAGETALSFARSGSACAVYLLARGAGPEDAAGRARPGEPGPMARVVTVSHVVDGMRARAKAERAREELTAEQERQHTDLVRRGMELSAQGDPAAALECFREALALAPDEAAFGGACRALVAIQEIDEALQMARECAKLFETAASFAQLGFLLEIAHNDDDAGECYERALELDPDNEMAQEGLDEIRHRFVLTLPNVRTVRIGNANRLTEDELGNIAGALQDFENEAK